MCLTYRPFVGGDEDYELLVRIFNSDPEISTTVERERMWVESYNTGFIHERVFATFGVETIGFVDWEQAPSSIAEGIAVARFFLKPDWRNKGHETSLLAHGIEGCRAIGAKTVSTTSRDDHPGTMRAVNELGFELRRRYVTTKLDLCHFDIGRHQAIIDKVSLGGVRICSMADLESQGIDWIPCARELNWSASQDEADSDNPNPQSFESYAAMAKSFSSKHPDCWLVALAGDEWVGMSSLFPNENRPKEAGTGTTCVAHAFRRRGIATALKAKALDNAKRIGVNTVTTSNEDGNPMLQLNFALGFRRDHEMHVFRKNLYP